jgi:hypothetical protein
VLRPEAWLMIGHCGGLRPTQKIGDYVLAHAYLRDDHVLDDVLPPEIPVPAIAEVQVALAQAAEVVSGSGGADLKTRMRTGTIVTTDDRNWELRYAHSARRLSLSRAVGIDMESATIAAQGYRFRVPYGTLLCVSDKPLHGKSSCPARPTGSTRKRLPPTSKSARPPAPCCVPRAIACTAASCALSTSRRSAERKRVRRCGGAPVPPGYSENGTPGTCLAVRMVSEVFTLATLGAGVSLLVRNSWKLCKSRLTILRMKSISPLSMWHSRTSGSVRICSSNWRSDSSAWLFRLTSAKTVIAKPSLAGSRSA